MRIKHRLKRLSEQHYIHLYVHIYCFCSFVLDSIFFFFLSSFISALETVDADKVYVLGGLVDESIQKVLHITEQQLHPAVTIFCSGQIKSNSSRN